MNQTFCTISSYSFMPYVLSLHDSLKQFNPDIHLHVMISDPVSDEDLKRYHKDNLFVTSYQVLCEDGMGKAICDKYAQQDQNLFRWAMKIGVNTLLIKYVRQGNLRRLRSELLQ